MSDEKPKPVIEPDADANNRNWLNRPLFARRGPGEKKPVKKVKR